MYANNINLHYNNTLPTGEGLMCQWPSIDNCKKPAYEIKYNKHGGIAKEPSNHPVTIELSLHHYPNLTSRGFIGK